MLSSVFSADENSFSLDHWNFHDTSSYPEILQMLDNTNCRFNIIGLCETFLTSKHSLSLFNFPGHQVIIRNRQTKARGGLAFIAKEHLLANVREGYSIWIEGKVETLTFEMEIGGNKLLISEVYKPPSTQW